MTVRFTNKQTESRRAFYVCKMPFNVCKMTFYVAQIIYVC